MMRYLNLVEVFDLHHQIIEQSQRARGIRVTQNQQAFIKSKQTSLNRLQTPFLRPSKPLYQGRPNILVGVSIGLEKLATVAIVDRTTQKVLTYQSIKQLLGNHYSLLNRQQNQKRCQSHQCNVAQRKESFNQFGDSELGQHIDRLLAKAIVVIAQKYHAGSIVLPKLDNMREIIQSEIQARAEAKIPNSLEAQAKYAKQYRIQVHQWSYGRLIETVRTQAAKTGVSIEEKQQQHKGTSQQKAARLAMDAYQSRISPLSAPLTIKQSQIFPKPSIRAKY